MAASRRVNTEFAARRSRNSGRYLNICQLVFIKYDLKQFIYIFFTDWYNQEEEEEEQSLHDTSEQNKYPEHREIRNIKEVMIIKNLLTNPEPVDTNLNDSILVKWFFGVLY